jgi:D-arabinose 1-dehydrogenase-like Zn-dependent alcohol dehydrogenase
MDSLPKTYRAAVIEAIKAPMVVKDLELKPPGRGQVLVKVIACGVCWSDHLIQSGGVGDIFPRVPGHEIVGDIVALGEGVTRLAIGDRAGGPWHGGMNNPSRHAPHSLSAP